MADFSLDFDTPASSSQRTVHVLGTINSDNTQRYVRIKLTVTEGTRNDVYYRTISVAPNTGATYIYHATYNIAIVPKILNTSVPSATYAFSLTAQA